MLPVLHNQNDIKISSHLPSKPVGFSAPHTNNSSLSCTQKSSSLNSCFSDLCNKIIDFFGWVFRWILSCGKEKAEIETDQKLSSPTFVSPQQTNQAAGSKAVPTEQPLAHQESSVTQATPVLHEEVENKKYIYIDIEKEASRFCFKDNEPLVARALSLIDEEVYNYMTGGSADEERFTHIQSRGFRILGVQVLEHPQLPGWIIKGGGGCPLPKGVSNSAGIGSPNRYDQLMRVFMAERMAQVALQEGLDIVIPEKRFLQVRSSPLLDKRYLVFSQKLDVLNESKTIQALSAITDDEQEKLARKVSILIQKTGFMDAHFGNICWSPTLKKICVIDTESFGLLIATQDLNPKTRKTVEECAKIGLHKLRHWSFATGLSIFEKEAERAIAEMG
jgi:hypothetical protein